VEIVDADVTFIWPEREVACYLDEEYTLEAFNTASSTGSFSLVNMKVTYPDGFMVDNGNNTATFHPSILNWIKGQDYTEVVRVRYDYLDGSTPLYETVDLEIEYFDTARIKTNLGVRDYCSNEAIIPLEGSRSTGRFSGPGVDSTQEFVYIYNPGLADTGINRIVYTYRSNNGCFQRDSVRVVVHEAPDPGFEFLDLCVPTGGGVIQFRNNSDVSGLPDSIQWVWNYGDAQSGLNEDIFYSMENGSHRYSRSGERRVTLTATIIENGCEEALSIQKYLGNTPEVSIDWNTECFTGDSTLLTGKSVSEDGNSTFEWKISDLEGNEIRTRTRSGLTIDAFRHKFEGIDDYRFDLTATTDSGCMASAEEVLHLRPYIASLTDSTPYYEDFEAGDAGWVSFKPVNSASNSWLVGEVKPGKFPYDAAEEGNQAWFTDSVTKNTVEKSWVTSPCFDFRKTRRPMISLDRKISSDRDRDGAVLQYSYNDGASWKNVGAVNDGSVNWYNTFRISDGPGGQGEGWTGGFVFDGSEPWKNSRHELDELIGRPRVQFRIAYSSSDTSVLNREGFAFDNVWIGERSRVVLLEHFTNAGVDNIAEANRRINDLVRHNPLDVIDLQYHAQVEGKTDRMNLDNPAPASARSLFYGTRQVPYALMDGGLAGEMAYDFSSNNDLDTLDLFARALASPSFNIDLEVTGQDRLGISIEIEALEDLPGHEYILYTVIVEKHINDPAYLMPGADTAFENVVRDMVPNASGISLLRNWKTGDREKVTLNWDMSSIVLNREMVYVVVFLQDAGNRTVYQSASNDPDLNGDPVINVSVQDVMRVRDLSILVYPNPASNRVYLAFAESLEESAELQIFTHTGLLLWNQLLPAGTETSELEVTGFSKGVYLIRILQGGRVMGIKKLMIVD
jgi:hypothetical protein